MSRFTTPPLSLRRQVSMNEKHGIRDTVLYPIITGKNTNRHPPRQELWMERQETIEDIINRLPDVIDGVENKKLLSIMTNILSNITSPRELPKEEPEMINEESDNIVEPTIEQPTIESEETEEIKTLYDVAVSAYEKGKDIYNIYENFMKITSSMSSLGSTALGIIRPLYKRSFMSGGALTHERVHINNYDRFHTNIYDSILPTDLQLGMRDNRNIMDITNTRRRN